MMSISVISKIISQIEVPLLKAVQIYRVREYEKSWDKMKTVMWIWLFQQVDEEYSRDEVVEIYIFRLKMYLKVFCENIYL